MRYRTRLTILMVTGLLFSIGCEGYLAGDVTEEYEPPGATSDEPSATDDSPDPSVDDVRCTDLSVGPAPLRRLTADQYENTVHDLLGTSEDLAERLPDGIDEGPGYVSGLTIQERDVEAYFDLAEELASSPVASLDRLVECDPAVEGEDPCAEQLIRNFGQRAYRRPLTHEEVRKLQAFYDAAKSDFGFDAAVRMLVQRILQSPHFLYIVEIGEPVDGSDYLALTDWEVATRLSYTIWNSMPDEALLEAAAAGQLTDTAGIEEQARRMLEDPRAREGLLNFYMQWLEASDETAPVKNQDFFPQWSPAVAESAREETRRFLEHVLFEGEGTFEEMLTASYTFADADLARLYDALEQMEFGSDWQSQDIGEVGTPGQFHEVGGRAEFAAGGHDIYGNADGFHFAWHELEGDGGIIAQVTDLQAPHQWTKAGVMIRESLEPGARHGLVALTGSNGVRMLVRELTDGSTDSTEGPSLQAPAWVRIERRGDRLIGSASEDGESWTEIASRHIPMPQSVYVGLAVASVDTAQPATAHFEKIRQAGVKRIELDPELRQGVLTQIGTLARFAHASQTSPIHRGIMVRERFLCQAMPPLPRDVNVMAPSVDPDATLREQLTELTGEAPCSSCHNLINPIGFAFEHYDAIGQYRSFENGHPIDSSGALVGASDLEHPEVEGLTGGQGLVPKLAGSTTAMKCHVKQFFRYSQQRFELQEDHCILAEAYEAFRETGGNIHEMLVAFVTAKAFRHRLAHDTTEDAE